MNASQLHLRLQLKVKSISLLFRFSEALWCWGHTCQQHMLGTWHPHRNPRSACTCPHTWRGIGPQRTRCSCQTCSPCPLSTMWRRTTADIPHLGICCIQGSRRRSRSHKASNSPLCIGHPSTACSRWSDRSLCWPCIWRCMGSQGHTSRQSRSCCCTRSRQDHRSRCCRTGRAGRTVRRTRRQQGQRE